MNLHQVTYTDNDGNDRRQFAGSADAASKLATELKSSGKTTSKPSRGQVDVPTSKVDLIAWLNKNAAAVA